MALLLIRESHYYLYTMTNFKDLAKAKESKTTKVEKEKKTTKVETGGIIKEKINPVTQCLDCDGDPDIEEINLSDFGGSKCKKCWRILSYFKK